jgi:hypothetical protein
MAEENLRVKTKTENKLNEQMKLIEDYNLKIMKNKRKN